MPGTTDTVKTILTPGEFVIRKEAVDMIGVPMLNMINNMPEKGGHSNIDKLIEMATTENMKGMYGGGMVKAGPKPMGHGGMVDAYRGGGMVMDQYGHGGMVKNKMMSYGHGGMVKDKMMMMEKGGQLKSVPEDNPGLGKLPEKVRNRMGYMQMGGMVDDSLMSMMGGGMAMKKNMMGMQEGGIVDMVKGLLSRMPMQSKSVEDIEQSGAPMVDMDAVLARKKMQDNAKFSIVPVVGEFKGKRIFQGSPEMKKYLDSDDHREYIRRKIRQAGPPQMTPLQDGGSVMLPPQPKDPLQIGARQADPSMYEGSTLGAVMDQAMMLEDSIEQDTVNRARKTLQLMRLKGMLGNAEMLDSPTGNPVLDREKQMREMQLREMFGNFSE